MGIAIVQGLQLLPYFVSNHGEPCVQGNKKSTGYGFDGAWYPVLFKYYYNYSYFAGMISMITVLL